ncbi:MAG: thioredoxin [Spirochaetes bacterium]|jgi:thioredoxin 1|nr:thioredoxin [Spirochaetota bacterium]
MSLLHLNSDNFKKEVEESELPVLVDFYADWCGPCRMIAPVIEKLAGKYEGKVKIAKLDVDSASDIAQKFDVSGIPTVILFKNGKAADRFSGALPENAIDDFISRNS